VAIRSPSEECFAHLGGVFNYVRESRYGWPAGEDSSGKVRGGSRPAAGAGGVDKVSGWTEGLASVGRNFFKLSNSSEALLKSLVSRTTRERTVCISWIAFW